MPRKGNQHVVTHPEGWAVRCEGNSRVTSIHDTQREAIEAGREIARNKVVSSSFTGATAASASGTASGITTPIRLRVR